MISHPPIRVASGSVCPVSSTISDGRTGNTIPNPIASISTAASAMGIARWENVMPAPG
ncbi:hypothetical protein LRS12_02080 [Sphingomonas sp. J344]|uniref:hypothetical protein n=1 Tax=Sphingomonas sp. J344 TaxID=2898434 RepID=UPI0021512EBE|nr:hypothetical protein [Sphingomonas sp. J344]MCR5869652.1 hypothetical protein [Sphingomonas sp. J344]